MPRAQLDKEKLAEPSELLTEWKLHSSSYGIPEELEEVELKSLFNLRCTMNLMGRQLWNQLLPVKWTITRELVGHGIQADGSRKNLQGVVNLHGYM